MLYKTTNIALVNGKYRENQLLSMVDGLDSRKSTIVLPHYMLWVIAKSKQILYISSYFLLD